MATRRNVTSTSTDKTISEAQGGADPALRTSDTAPAVPAAVIYKLLGFTFAMIFVPISSYFMTLNTIFGGNATYAGATAAVMANVVLVGYIIVAMREDQSEQIEAAAEERRKKGL